MKHTLRRFYRRAKILQYQARGTYPALPLDATLAAEQTIFLGSDYGGRTIEIRDDLYGSTIISAGAGAGEDISFDVGFAQRFGAKVIIVDPTPRAITHVRSVLSQIATGSANTDIIKPSDHGHHYDLASLTADQLVLEPLALWNQRQRVKFFAPKNEAHVSHSILNYLNDTATDAVHIEVDAVPIDELMEKHGITRLPLLKLDIEGAASEVIEDMLHKQIRPSQIAVEFDELKRPSKKVKNRINDLHDLLKFNGYRLQHKADNGLDFLYGLTARH